ncbi:SDR family NAD(P)-dependent oxidoreductase [Occallatibacter savannae]|uniref:SDR family NAD(P)-dependent oxidoreductase n=1 Tax=Occallatibacter savannae TaxID=1002691 RepID=UPI000D69EA02|nr:SDR family oxidoreductase [Occallatibacter savannae]
MTSEPLLGKSALVTGGARRIGREIALNLAAAGAEVTITYLKSRHEAEETIREIKDLGRLAIAVECDVRTEQSVRDAVVAAVNFHGHLDVVVNNAGVFQSVPLDQLTLEQWDDVFATNARGPFLLARQAISHLRKTHGRIINIGSLGGIHAWASHAHYCSSKAALHMLTQTMARAFAPEVAVNCVAPGYIDLGEAETRQEAEHFAAKTPLKRNGTARDVADAVLFFATATNFITGQVLAVDGGLGL